MDISAIELIDIARDSKWLTEKMQEVHTIMEDKEEQLGLIHYSLLAVLFGEDFVSKVTDTFIRGEIMILQSFFTLGYMKGIQVKEDKDLEYKLYR